MVQQTGETRDAIIEDDNKILEQIINENRELKDPYWIVIFATPSKGRLAGKPALMKHIKAYKTKPVSQVGMITGEVSNQKGTITWEVNMPQKPFDYDALQGVGAERKSEVVVETTTIPGAYVTK